MLPQGTNMWLIGCLLVFLWWQCSQFYLGMLYLRWNICYDHIAMLLSITQHKHISFIRLPWSNRQRDRALWSRLAIFTPLHELKQVSTWATYSYYKVEMWSNCRATRSTSSRSCQRLLYRSLTQRLCPMPTFSDVDIHRRSNDLLQILKGVFEKIRSSKDKKRR